MEFGLMSPFLGAVCWPLQTGHQGMAETLDGILYPHTHPPTRPAPGLPADPRTPRPRWVRLAVGPPGLPATLEHRSSWRWWLHLPAASARGVFGVRRWCGELEVGELQTLPPPTLSLLSWGSWHSHSGWGVDTAPIVL